MKAIVACLLVLFAASTVRSADTTGPGPSGLKCEYLVDPVGIDVERPRFSWILNPGTRGTSQTAYQVMVTRSNNDQGHPKSLAWDSGKVFSGESTQIEYGGPALQSTEGFSWKVRIWDQAGEVTAWSESARWSMGLLKSTDWHGRWIGLAEASHEKPPLSAGPLLRKGFAITAPVRRATVYVCGLGYHELYLNGHKVGDHVLDPPVTNYEKRALYVTHDVTALLAPGQNALGVALGNGCYNTTVPDSWKYQTAPWKALPQALVELDVEYADGSRQQTTSDASWKTADGPSTFDQMRVGENYDARLEQPGWSTAAFDDSAWTPVAVREGPQGDLHATDTEPIKVVETITPVKMTEPQPGVYVFDLGKNIAGWEQLTVQGPAGTVVRMSCGELLHPDGTLDRSNVSVDVKSPDVQVDTYTLKGGGLETWEPRFTFHGFQYVQLEGFPGQPTMDTIRGRVVRTSFAPAGSFSCSNDLLNRIEQATVLSYTSNFVGYPTDCPQREKNGWTGDAQLAATLGLEHFHGEAAYTRWLNDFDDALRADGKLPGIVPSPGWGYDFLDGPAWESAYLLISWELYEQAGDRRILVRHYDGFKKWLGWYTRLAKDHIVSYGLGDWVPAKTKTPADLTSTAYYYRDARIVAKTAELLGRTDEAQRYTQLADDIADAFNARFFDPKTGQYANGSQTALSAALYFGLVKDGDRSRVVQNLAAAVSRADGHIDTGILGSKYLLRALSDNGHVDLAYGMATQTTAPSWGFWLAHGATTLWEEWGTGRSHNHIMFGDISSWFTEYLAGIRPNPQAVGYKAFLIQPTVPTGLMAARATRDSPYGMIESEWSRAGDRYTLKVTVPANTTAKVCVPTSDPASVQEGGQELSQAAGVTFQGPGENAVRCQVGAGRYVFTSVLAIPGPAATR